MRNGLRLAALASILIAGAALADLAPNAPVYKYGEEIGKMKVAIKKGAWIHIHNMYCERGM